MCGIMNTQSCGSIQYIFEICPTESSGTYSQITVNRIVASTFMAKSLMHKVQNQIIITPEQFDHMCTPGGMQAPKLEARRELL